MEKKKHKKLFIFRSFVAQQDVVEEVGFFKQNGNNSMR